MSETPAYFDTATALREEFPLLWKLGQQYDFAERLGGSNDPLAREADAALRELWMARTTHSRPLGGAE